MSTPVTNMRLNCTKQVPSPCTRRAVELLLICDGVGISTHARCDQHPAADDIPILRRIQPLATCLRVVVPADGLEEL